MKTFIFTHKTLLELIVLKIISSNPQPGKVILEILQKINFSTPEGTLYPLLSELKRQSFIHQYYEEMNTGPARRCYSITETGKKHLDILKKEWRKTEQTIFRADH